MGVFDQAGRYAIKRMPSAFFTWRVPQLWLAWKFVRWQDTRTLPFPGEPDRVCDQARQAVSRRAVAKMRGFKKRATSKLALRGCIGLDKPLAPPGRTPK